MYYFIYSLSNLKFVLKCIFQQYISHGWYRCWDHGGSRCSSFKYVTQVTQMNQKSKQQNWTTASQVFNNKNIANFICIPYDYRSEYKRSQKRILTSHMAIFQKWAPFALEGQNDNFWTFFVCKHIPPRNLNMKFKFKNSFNWRYHLQLCLHLTTCAFRAPSFTCEL